MVVFSHSSTPVMTYAAALIGLLMWQMRKKLRQLRWALVILIIAAQFFMS